MSRVMINALSLRPGGGLQVLIGLLSRFSAANEFIVLVSDPDSREILHCEIGDRAHIKLEDPIGSASAAASFWWSMTSQARWVRSHGIDCVMGVNHAFPTAGVPQIIYHLNVLRFERPKQPFWATGELADRLRDWRARVALSKATINMFESQYLLNAARQAGVHIQTPEIVYIGLRDPLAEPLERAVESGRILVVTSGAPHKDNPTLVRMLAALVEKAPETHWHLRVAGNPNESLRNSFLETAQPLGISDHITFIGFADHSTLLQEGSKALCLVSTSLVESFCMVGLEAMSWGCPVIVADASAMPESVQDAAILAKPGDAHSFANAVLRLHEDPDFQSDLIVKGLDRASQMTWSHAAQTVEAHIVQAASGLENTSQTGVS